MHLFATHKIYFFVASLLNYHSKESFVKDEFERRNYQEISPK